MVNPVLGELCRIQNILEDAYVDYHVAERWKVLGDHIRVSRQKLNEQRLIDLDAISRRARPDCNADLNLWIAISLYDYELTPTHDPSGAPGHNAPAEPHPSDCRHRAIIALEYVLGLIPTLEAG